jgi:hypothetical protein
MVLNPNVLVAEADVAAACGTTLTTLTAGPMSGTPGYLLYGLQIPQVNFESRINMVANGEENLLGDDTYHSSSTLIAQAMLNYQVADSAYAIVLSLPGYSATYFNYGQGDERFDPTPLITLLNGQAERYKEERDRAFRALQDVLVNATGVGTIDMDQPGVSQPAAPVY